MWMKEGSLLSKCGEEIVACNVSSVCPNGWPSLPLRRPFQSSVMTSFFSFTTKKKFTLSGCRTTSISPPHVLDETIPFPRTRECASKCTMLRPLLRHRRLLGSALPPTLQPLPSPHPDPAIHSPLSRSSYRRGPRMDCRQI